MAMFLNEPLPPATSAEWEFPESAISPDDSSVHGNVTVERYHGDVTVRCGQAAIRLLGSNAEQVGLAVVAAARGTA